jgi:hypothetical protein
MEDHTIGGADLTGIFINDGAGNFVAITLEGQPGNRSGMGARLVFEHSDDHREARDIAAGGGYLTQNSAKIHHSSPGSNPLRKVSITWPDGARSQTAIPPRQQRRDRPAAIAGPNPARCAEPESRPKPRVSRRPATIFAGKAAAAAIWLRSSD